jgi:hypothetical protein
MGRYHFGDLEVVEMILKRNDYRIYAVHVDVKESALNFQNNHLEQFFVNDVSNKDISNVL